MFNPFRMIRAAFDRSHLLGAVDASPADAQFIRASQLPADPADMIEAGTITPWRVSADGERWFKVVDGASLDRWSPHTCPIRRAELDDSDFDPDTDFYRHDAADSDTDIFDELPGPAGDDDGDFDDRRNPYRGSGHVHDT